MNTNVGRINSLITTPTIILDLEHNLDINLNDNFTSDNIDSSAY